MADDDFDIDLGLGEVEDLDDDTSDEGSDLGNDEKEDGKESEDKEEDESSDGKSDGKEKEVEEKEEEDVDFSGVFPRPSYKQITTKFPELFKTFPALKSALFREKDFSEVFPTVGEAKEAAEAAQNFEAIKELLHTGNIAPILKGTKEDSPTALKRLAERFLPTLHEIDKQAFEIASEPLVKSVLRHALSNAETHNNANLKNSVHHLTKFLFGSLDLEVKKRAEDQPDPERLQLVRERSEFEETRKQEKLQTVSLVIEKRLKADILKAIEKDEVTDYTRNSIVRDTIAGLNSYLSRNREHSASMAELWKRAAKEGYSEAALRRIANTYLSRAQKLLPPIRSKIRAQALGKNKVREKVEEKSESRGTSGKQVSSKPKTDKSDSGLSDKQLMEKLMGA